MKKSFIIIAAAALILTACSDVESLKEVNNESNNNGVIRILLLKVPYSKQLRLK